MANPRPVPRPENLRPPWPKGTSGNPGGYSARKRVADALARALSIPGADDALARIWLAMALGDTKALGGRRPDFRFFKELLDRLEGKAPVGPGPVGRLDVRLLDDDELLDRISGRTDPA